MSRAEELLPEFDHEIAKTRLTLARIPEEKLDWRPHDKSMTFRGLATHLANLPSWAAIVLSQDSFDMAPPSGEPPRVEPVKSLVEALDMFEGNAIRARSALETAGDDLLFSSWTLLSGGNPVFSSPRIAVLRSMVLSHMIHHRAQLGVYLRLNDQPVPALYGPSADESS